MGGHVWIEAKADSILNFLPKGKFHWFSKNLNRHSAYAIHTENGFYSILVIIRIVKKGQLFTFQLHNNKLLQLLT